MKLGVCLIIILLLLISITGATTYDLSSQRSITTGETNNYLYLKINTPTHTNYVGIDKRLGTRGNLVIGQQTPQGINIYATITQVAAYQNAGTWYLCPTTGLLGITGTTKTSNTIGYDSTEIALTCYDYANHANTISPGMTISSRLTSDHNAHIKINTTTTVLAGSPTDTGFAYLIIPEDQSVFRYANINGEIKELSGVEGAVSIDKAITFLDQNIQPIAESFDWNDMLDTGNTYSEILTIGGRKGLLIGTYGYGATNTINVDPIYTVDYSPIPGQWLINEDVNQQGDNNFTTQDVTAGLSDNQDTTNYTTNKFRKNNTIINYTDGISDTTNYINADGDISAQDYFIHQPTTGEQFCVRATENNGANASVYNNQTLIAQITLPTGTSTTIWTCVDLDPSTILEGRNRIGLGCSDGCGGASRIWIHTDTTTPQGEDYLYSGGTWTQQAYNHMYYLILNGSYETNGNAISGTWNKTYDPNYDWYARIKILTPATNIAHIFAYENNNNISTNNESYQLNGAGYYNINVSSLLDYETNTQGLNYTKLRVFTDFNQSIAELRLRQETNDTEAPTINEYSINNTNLKCLNTATLSANITDTIGIDKVNYTINNINYTPTKNFDNYTYTLMPTTDGSQTYNWTAIHALDVAGNRNQTYPNIQSNYSCDFATYINIQHDNNTDIKYTNESATINWTTNNTASSEVNYGETTNLGTSVGDMNYKTIHSVNLTGLSENTTYFYNLTSTHNPTQTLGEFTFATEQSCTENWQPIYTNTSSCHTNNTIFQFLTYNDTNACGTTNDLPVDNGTNVTSYCNFCDPNWVELTGGVHECQTNGTRYVEYVDLNTCYFQTGLAEDAPPIDHETSVACNYNTQEFNCSIDTNPYLNQKVEYQCTLPYTGTEWKCINQVKQFTGETLQVNPQKTEKATTLINFKPTIESREAFTTTLGILNAYYTNKNLIPYATFSLETTCSDGNQTLIYQETINTDLREPGEISGYWVWTTKNIGLVIAGLLGILIIVIVAMVIVRNIRR